MFDTSTLPLIKNKKSIIVLISWMAPSAIFFSIVSFCILRHLRFFSFFRNVFLFPLLTKFIHAGQYIRPPFKFELVPFNHSQSQVRTAAVLRYIRNNHWDILLEQACQTQTIARAANWVLKLVKLTVIVYYINGLKHNQDYYIFENFLFHFKLCNTGWGFATTLVTTHHYIRWLQTLFD